MITRGGRWLLAVLSVALFAAATPADDAALLDAVRRGDVAAVRAALRDGASPNAAQGDGLSALHLAADQGNLEVVRVLLGAKANVEAKTQIGEYTPLHVAAEAGHATVVRALLEAGANAGAVTSNTGVTPLHLAAKAIDGAGAVRELLARGAAVNAVEKSAGQTPLMFAAAYGRLPAIQELLKGGADPAIRTEVVDVLRRVAIDHAAKERLKQALIEVRRASPEGTDRELTAEEEHRAIEMQRAWLASPQQIAGTLEDFNPDQLATRGPLWLHPTCRGDNAQTPEERLTQTVGCGDDLKSPVTIGWRPIWETLVGKTGGMTALLHAVREGHAEAAQALLDAGADIDQVSGDGSSPLVLALMNGHFDLSMKLIERGADVNLVAETDGVSPLFAVLQTRWANYTTQPQPRAQELQQTDYLQVMKALLDKGAEPNPRLFTHLWYWEYANGSGGNGGASFGIDITGATPFWRAAVALDVEAMKLLVAYGADPNIPTRWPEVGMRVGRQSDGRIQDDSGIPRLEGQPNMYPIQAASGAGYMGHAPEEISRLPGRNFLAAVKYMVEDLGVDVNLTDSWGYTPLHYAAAAAANDLIEYLVSKGANVNALSVLGQSPVDFTRGGQAGYFVRPAYPQTTELLLRLGSEFKCINTHFRGTGDYCPTSGLKPWGSMGGQVSALTP